MRINFLLPKVNLTGGVRVAAIYAEAMHKLGHEVTVVSARGPRIDPLFEAKLWVKSLLKPGSVTRAKDAQASHFDGHPARHIIAARRGPIRASDVPDGDVLVATWWETAAWAAEMPASKGAPVYFIQHHEVFDQANADRVRATYRLPMHKVTISRWLVDLMQQTYGDPTVDLIHNSADTDQFHAPPRGKQPRPTVGLLYSTVGFKGLDVSIRALHLLREKLPDLQVVAFGSMPMSEGLMLPNFTQYTLRPAQDRIRDLYARCDLWLCGSRAEGFHLPPSEAMACRCPVVSTRVGGPMDIIRDGENGYLVDVGDAEALAQRAYDVLSLPEAGWRAMSDAAYRTVTGFTWSDAAALFEASLARAVERREGGETGFGRSGR